MLKGKPAKILTNLAFFARQPVHLNIYIFIDASVSSPKSAQFSPRKSTNDSDVVKCEILNGETQKEVLNVTITPKTQLDKMLPPVITTVQNKSMKTSVRDYT